MNTEREFQRASLQDRIDVSTPYNSKSKYRPVEEYESYISFYDDSGAKNFMCWFWNNEGVEKFRTYFPFCEKISKADPKQQEIIFADTGNGIYKKQRRRYPNEILIVFETPKASRYFERWWNKLGRVQFNNWI